MNDSALRLDYVSPLPPVRTGIADYSRDLLPHLAALADVRVLRLPEQSISREMEEVWHPVAAERCGEDGRLPLYQMGNNRHHAAVWSLALERPGVLVLHDLVLHHFLLERTVGRGDYATYARELERDEGWVGELAAKPLRWGGFGQATQFALFAHRTLLRRQRGVVVHGEWAADMLAEEDPELAVRIVPMGIPLPAAANREAGRAFRARHRLPDAAPVLGSFGFQTPIKRTEVAIRALAEPGFESAHLLIAGELSPYVNYEGYAAQLGVGERVHVVGFLPFAEMEEAIAATDLCLNLRYPTAGETSASLLRILAVGRPVVVSDHAQFAELPPAIAVRVPLGEDEPALLAAALGELLAAPARLAEMGVAARDYVRREHDPAGAAAAVVAACGELGALAPPGDARRESPPPTTLVTRQAGARIEVDGWEAWPEGERRRLAVRVTNTGPSRWLASHREPGGVMLEIQLFAGDRNYHDDRPWLALPHDLAPGESYAWEVELRRPLGPARLLFKPSVLELEGHRPLRAAAPWDRTL